MPLVTARRTHRLTHRAIATVVALSLLASPVTYRGGAEAAHAHTIFQLWADVRSGSFTHHAREHEPREAHGEPTGDPVAGDPVAGDRAAGDHPAETGHRSGEDGIEADHDGTSVRDGAGARELARGSPTGSAVALELDGDAPVASSAFTPSVRGTVLVLQAAIGWPQTEAMRLASRRMHRPSGITDSPIAPPPRRAA